MFGYTDSNSSPAVAKKQGGKHFKFSNDLTTTSRPIHLFGERRNIVQRRRARSHTTNTRDISARLGYTRHFHDEVCETSVRNGHVSMGRNGELADAGISHLPTWQCPLIHFCIADGSSLLACQSRSRSRCTQLPSSDAPEDTDWWCSLSMSRRHLSTDQLVISLALLPKSSGNILLLCVCVGRVKLGSWQAVRRGEAYAETGLQHHVTH